MQMAFSLMHLNQYFVSAMAKCAHYIAVSETEELICDCCCIGNVIMRSLFFRVI